MMDERKAQCQGCGLEPNVRSGDAVIWCDECYSELRDRLARMQPVVDAANMLDGRFMIHNVSQLLEAVADYNREKT